MTTSSVRVDLPGREYDILIGPGTLDQAGDALARMGGRSHVPIITDENVAVLHLPRLQGILETAGLSCDSLVLPAGESTKSWAMLERSVEWLLEQRVERGDVVIAFGGGVIGDLAGFAAAVLRRGVRFVQIPTSLLAQVDSSVGGKTGINSPHGKNLVGAFHQPSLVIADTGLLDTMTERDFLAGYGEVVKYGLLGDADFFARLERQADALRNRDRDVLVAAVTRSCEMKADIVRRDETEQGDRALLNLGHTFCHALEAATGYSDRLLHGEGVAIGCALAFDVSARLGLCSQEDPSRVRAHLREMGMKVDIRDIPGDLAPAQTLLDLMGQDKKVVAGKLRFILARGIGEAFITSDVPPEVVLEALQDAGASA